MGACLCFVWCGLADLVHVHHVIQRAVRDVQVRDVGQEVVPHEDTHEDEVVDHPLQLELEGQLSTPDHGTAQQSTAQQETSSARRLGESGGVPSYERARQNGDQ